MITKNISKENKISQLERVLESDTFKLSPTSSRLLRFLTNATLEGKELKETTVGIEIFGNSFIEDASSSKMRVSIYNLRKKLKAYYSDEGKNDALKIEIRKGQYYTDFIINKEIRIEKSAVDNYKNRFVMALSAVGVLGLFVIGLLVYFLYQPSTPIWDSFFTNKKETIVVVGDVFGVLGKTATGQVGWNRDYNINSMADFYKLKNENPKIAEGIKPSDYTYLTSSGVLGTKVLSDFFFQQKSDFTVRFSSKLNYADLKENNTVYIGPMKNKNMFIDYVNNYNKHFNIQDFKIRYKNNLKKIDTVFDLRETDGIKDYALVCRIKGQANKGEQFFFFSDHDIGNIAVVEYFTNKDNLASFTKKYLQESESFVAVFLVEGKDRTNLGIKLLLVDAEKGK